MRAFPSFDVSSDDDEAYRPSISNIAIPTDCRRERRQMPQIPKDNEKCCDYSNQKGDLHEIDQSLRFHKSFSDDLEIFIDKLLITK